MKEGILTEIERFALNDGPGIRTVVFFKGCNMNCAWCHNPETIRKNKELHYYTEKCISCYKCVYACPSKAQKRLSNEHRFFPNLCVTCGKCAEICYAGAMAVSGNKCRIEDIMQEIIQDKPYYTNSGGGVTLSGGEVLCQQEFADALTDACHAEGISVGIETNLNFPWNQIAPFLEKVELVMCDLKLFDNEAHQKWTGTGNEQIKENIRQLAQHNIPFLVRTPLIPGATDTNENISQIAEFLASVDPTHQMLYYELLNFNPLGDIKYRSLRRTNPFSSAKPLPQSRLNELRKLAASTGISVRME